MLGVQKTDDPSTATPTEMAAARRAEQAPLASAPKLLDRLREALHSRHYSRRTEQTYWYWVKRFIYFHTVRHHVHESILQSAMRREGYIRTREEPGTSYLERGSLCLPSYTDCMIIVGGH